MSRKKPQARCAQCRMRQELCVCSELATLRAVLKELRPYPTRVSLLMHYKEERLSTNTGRLAQLALEDCQVHLRGLPDTIVADLNDSTRRTVLLYPSETAVPLDPEFFASDPRPVHLVVPDGSWRQASKVAKRELWLEHAQHVMLPPSRLKPTRYFLRDEPKAGGLATYEAIARCLGAIESPTIQTHLENFFELFVSRTLKSRGLDHPVRPI